MTAEHSFVDSHLAHIREGLRLLQEMAQGPLEREALAAELEGLWRGLPHSTTYHQDLAAAPVGMAADCIRSLTDSIDLLEKRNAPLLEGDWVAWARKTLGRVAEAVRREKAGRVSGLYVIADPEVARGRDIAEVARAALLGGASMIQLRDKHRDKGDLLPIALRLAELCRQRNALFIVNDHVDLAVACGADGVHLGQHDLPVAQARRILSPGQLIGRSNALVEEAQESQQQGADYIAAGAMFPTSTKENTRPAGVETLRRVRGVVSAPLVAIGGINPGNVAQVVSAGADAICVTGAVVAADDPEEAAKRLVAIIQKARPQPQVATHRR